MRRVALVLADGLRPDTVRSTTMPVLDALGCDYVRALDARTVRPSVTVAALASLATGVGPSSHGLVEPGLRFLTRLGALRPLPRELGALSMRTQIVTGTLSPCAAPILRAIGRFAGIAASTHVGNHARESAVRARELFETMDEGLLFLYLPDCDRAGHADGWLSPAYLAAAAEVDAAIGLFTAGLGDGTMFVVADHGGGGVRPRDHDLPHPTNDAIPLVIAGRDVRRHSVLAPPVSLLDVPPTVLWHLGGAVPTEWEGRILRDAFLHRSLSSEEAAA